MQPDRDNRRRKPLVTVGEHRETDIATGEVEHQRFVKMYFEARDSGLLAAIPDELWKTLCCLATYIDETGRCYPNQSTIGRALGVGRQAANQRIQRLRDFRFNGQPVMRIEKARVHSAKGPTRWANNVYHVLPITGFDYGKGRGDREALEKSGDFSVSSGRDTELSEQGDQVSVSSSVQPVADTARRDTNKNQYVTRKNTRLRRGVDSSSNRTGPAGALVAYFHSKAGHPADQEPAEKEFKQAAELVAEHGEETARWIVNFALQRAEETSFRPRHLGAVLSYVSEALNARERHRAAERRREEQTTAEREREKQLKEEREAYAALSPEERLERDLQRWRMFFPALHKNREPTELELEAKRRELAVQHGLADDEEVAAGPESLTA
jgi:hypothetical protein